MSHCRDARDRSVAGGAVEQSYSFLQLKSSTSLKNAEVVAVVNTGLFVLSSRIVADKEVILLCSFLLCFGIRLIFYGSESPHIMSYFL